MPYQLASGYIQLNDVEHRKQYEHRVIWQENVGLIPSGFEIHHKNGIKNDNHINNLSLVQIKTHRQLHPMSKLQRERVGQRTHTLELTGKIKHLKNEEHGAWIDLPNEEILFLFREGISPNKIADMFSVDKSTIQKRINIYGGGNYAL